MDNWSTGPADLKFSSSFPEMTKEEWDNWLQADRERAEFREREKARLRKEYIFGVL